MKEGGEYRQTLNFAFDKLLPKVNLSNSFSVFYHLKSDFIEFSYFLILSSVFFGVAMPHSYTGSFPRMGGGVQVLMD